MYVARWNAESSFSAMLAWGLKRLSNGTDLNGLLLEGEYTPCDPLTFFARGEWEENDEIVPRSISRIGEISLGGIRDFRSSEHWKVGFGGLYTFDFTPHAIPAYGADPHGAMAFMRVAAD